MLCQLYSTIKIKDIFILTAHFPALCLIVLGRKYKDEDIIQRQRKNKTRFRNKILKLEVGRKISLWGKIVFEVLT